jgi:hypothetical protein
LSEIDQSKAYSEACNTLRHYSNASFGVRSASVVQGLSILVAWVVTLTKPTPKPLLAFGLPTAGLLFTLLLYRFHMGYFRASEFFYQYAAQIEQKLFDEDCRPITAYDARHGELYKSAWSRMTTLNAPFTLVAVLFFSALILDVLMFKI